MPGTKPSSAVTCTAAAGSIVIEPVTESVSASVGEARSSRVEPASNTTEPTCSEPVTGPSADSAVAIMKTAAAGCATAAGACGPTASVPPLPTVTGPATVPVPPRVPPATVTAMPAPVLPLMRSVPASIRIVPVAAWVPLSTSTPSPVFRSPPVPVNTTGTGTVEPSGTSMVTVPWFRAISGMPANWSVASLPSSSTSTVPSASDIFGAA